MRSDVTIQRADVFTFGVLAALYARCFDEPWPEPAVRDLMESFGVWALVATVRTRRTENADAVGDLPAWDGPVGFIMARIIAREGEILALGTDPGFRRKGVAAALLKRALALGEGHADRFFLEVGADNPAAIALYRHFGFKKISIRKDYYRRADRRRVDALLMRFDYETTTILR